MLCHSMPDLYNSSAYDNAYPTIIFIAFLYLSYNGMR